jgi:hypothetical protein
MNSNLAEQLFQEPFSLVIVEKPSHVAQTPQQQAIANSIAAMFAPKTTPCISSLREPKGIFVSTTGRRFEALEYGKNRRVFQALDNGATYHMEVIMEQIGNMVMVVSLMNRNVVSTQDYIIYPRYAGMGRYLSRAEEAVAGAFDHLQSLVLSGKA